MGDETSFLRDTREYLERLERLGFAGVVLVARDGEPVLVEGYGLADRERSLRWSPDTVSCIGSLTKQFTAAAILLLEAEGLLSTGDTINRFFDVVPGDKRPITLHHLLTHSSGIVDLEGCGDWDPVGCKEFVRRALEQTLEFPPGRGYSYSNAGYSLLGAVLEKVSGTSYEELVRQRLFLPQGLSETGYLLVTWQEERLAQGYVGGRPWGTVLERPRELDGPYWQLRANGEIHSTAWDMLRWGMALLEERVLPAVDLARSWAPHVRCDRQADGFYGYGWSVWKGPGGLEVVTHSGSVGPFYADMAIAPAARLLVFLQSNVLAELPLVRSLLGQIGSRLLDGQPYPATPSVVEVADEELASLAGDYQLPEGGSLRVIATEGKVVIEPRGRIAFTRLHSTRRVDLERAEGLTARLDGALGPLFEGDAGPLHRVYGERIPLAKLQSHWDRRLRFLEERFGPRRGYDILGTALQGERDYSLVLYRFQRGSVRRTFVWDGHAEAFLIGVSRSGFEPGVRCFPVAGGGFAAWHPGTGCFRPIRFEGVARGGLRLVLGEGELEVEAQRPDR